MEDLVEFSRQRIERGSKSFAMAARVFSPEARASAYMLYAWCRHCDDVIDGQILGFGATAPSAGREQAVAVANELEAKTRAALAGNADEPEFRALAVVCERHGIPDRHPLELIAGFRMDAEERQYVTFEDTLEYCYHVAGVVGVMMAMIMGAKERDVLNRASDLGIAFQLTNIARDVVPDHDVGRVYLPAEWLASAGLSQETMAASDNRPALFQVAERLLAAADPYYESAGHGLSDLPLRSAWAVAAARSVYRGIGTEVRRRGPMAWDTRTTTSTTSKLLGVAGGLASACASRLPLTSRQSHARQGLWTMPGLGTDGNHSG